MCVRACPCVKKEGTKGSQPHQRMPFHHSLIAVEVEGGSKCDFSSERHIQTPACMTPLNPTHTHYHHHHTYTLVAASSITAPLVYASITCNVL